jgi:hypothetical protein
MDSEQAQTFRQFPAGWFTSGSSPKDYEVRIDRTQHYSGKASGYIGNKDDDPKGFGTLMQVFKADMYRGKRLKMTGYVKTEEVETWAGLWMRVDGPGGAILAFDNMQDRPIRGTIGWEEYEIVLDVPENGVNVSFGILLAGRGKAWADDFAFQTVGMDVPVTDMKGKLKAMPVEPSNLGFED